MFASRGQVEASLSSWLERFSEKMRTRFQIAVEKMKTLSMDCIRIATDSKHQRTLLVIENASPAPVLDQRADNEFLPETFVESAGMKEMKLAVLSWGQMDIFLSHDDAYGGDDC